MTNAYDCAHQLARAIKESDEFKKFQKIHQEVMAEKALKEMLDDFGKKQQELHELHASGKTLGEDQLESLQKLYDVLSKDPKIAEYMSAEMRFSQFINDVHKIIEDALVEFKTTE